MGNERAGRLAFLRRDRRRALAKLAAVEKQIFRLVQTGRQLERELASTKRRLTREQERAELWREQLRSLEQAIEILDGGRKPS